MFAQECIYINYLQGTSNNCLIVMVGTLIAFICLTVDELDFKKPHERNEAYNFSLLER